MVRFRPLKLILAALVGILMAWAPLTSQAEAHGDMGPVKVQKATGKPCLKPEGEMRRNHMDILKHKRAVTVREGIRVRDKSLIGCISCHPSKKQFCAQCHKYVGVKPDCFECHNYPD